MGVVMYNKRQIGGEYEDLAIKYLIDNGYTVLERNFFHRGGEIDIIAIQDRYLVFVEVKYRSTTQNGFPEEAIGYYKKKSIIKTASYYMYTHGYLEDTPCRFDVVVILGNDIKLIQNAFEL